MQKRKKIKHRALGEGIVRGYDLKNVMVEFADRAEIFTFDLDFCADQDVLEIEK